MANDPPGTSNAVCTFSWLGFTDALNVIHLCERCGRDLQGYTKMIPSGWLLGFQKGGGR